MQIWAESGKSALPICNYSQILYQFLTFTQNLKRSPEAACLAGSKTCGSYSNSFLPSCFMVFFIGLDGENQEVLSDFYLLCGFLRDYIVILLSLTISIKAVMAILKISSHNSLNRMVIPKLL